MPSKPSAPTGFTAHDLAREVGVSRDSIFTWSARGLLPPVVFRGIHTRYGASHQLRAKVIARMRKAGASYDDIALALAVSDDELIRRDAPAAPPAAPPTPPAVAPAPPSFSAPTWQRVELLPGLELHVATAASAFVQRVADEVIARYRAIASEAPVAPLA